MPSRSAARLRLAGVKPNAAHATKIPWSLDLAKVEWAKLDVKPVPQTLRKLGDVFDRYEREIIPAKASRTQRG